MCAVGTREVAGSTFVTIVLKISSESYDASTKTIISGKMQY